MITRALRQSMKRQEGQALVLAALMVLVLSIAVITTVNLGHTVHERIRLQNTSDAAAYSMAAMEARAFNFYAFANRTQVSHYVSAMLWQSVLSFIYFAEAFLVDVYGVMKSLNPCVNPSSYWVPLCAALKVVPYVGQLINMIGQFIGVFRNFISRIILPLLRYVDPDRLIGRYLIPAHRLLNGVLAAASTAMMYATLSHVVQTSSQVVAENDSNIDSLGSRALTGLLSACIFNRAHMKEANGDALGPANPFRPIRPDAVRENEKESRAKRAMGGISNATRFPCDQPGSWCPPGWVTDRRPANLLPLPSWMGFFRSLLNMLPEWKWGQTKMLTTGLAKGRPWRGDVNFIRDWKDAPNAPMSMMAQGDDIGSDDLYQIKLGPSRVTFFKNPFSCSNDDDPAECWGDPQKGRNDSPSRKLPFRYMLKTSIWAFNDAEGIPGGLHYRLAYVQPRWPQGAGWAAPKGGTFLSPNNEANIGLSKFKKCILPLVCPFTVWTANVRGVQDGNHSWPGVVPFSHFEPGQYDKACGQSLSGSAPDLANAATRAEEFNQPSSWVMLRKNAAQMLNPLTDPTGAGTNRPALLNTNASLTFAFSRQGATLKLDDTRKKFLGMEGLNVVSRGQTYYHRPGNWAEMPNFFNPYWRPRLASVWQGRNSLPFVGSLAGALPGPIRNIPQKIITH